jgi:uncharacterized protein YcbX
MRLASLTVYPLKGAAGIAVEEWPLDAFGLVHDRRWMVVDDEGGFVSMRGDPLLGQVRTSLTDDALELRADTHACSLPFEPVGDPVRVRIWGDAVDAVDCGADAASFMSAHLGRAVRVVHMPDTTLRRLDPAYAPHGGRVSFADGYPLLVIGDGSLAELNRRLDEPVPMVRFRPNIVVGDATPHAEDSWRSIRIGDVLVDVVKPCARCVVPTIDPETGIAGREPTRTLAGYRRWDRKVWFGQNAIHHGPGTLTVGAAVQVLEVGEPEPPLLA